MAETAIFDARITDGKHTDWTQPEKIRVTDEEIAEGQRNSRLARRPVALMVEIPGVSEDQLTLL